MVATRVTKSKERRYRFASNQAKVIFTFKADRSKGQSFNPFTFKFDPYTDYSEGMSKPKRKCQKFITKTEKLPEEAGPEYAGKNLFEFLTTRSGFSKKPGKKKFWIDQEHEKKEDALEKDRQLEAKDKEIEDLKKQLAEKPGTKKTSKRKGVKASDGEEKESNPEPAPADAPADAPAPAEEPKKDEGEGEKEPVAA